MSKEVITRNRVLEIIKGYPTLKSLSGVKLAYAISRNMRELQKEQVLIEEMLSFSEEFKEYMQKYNDIVESLAKRDNSGNYVLVGNDQIAISNPVIFKEKLVVLDEEYKEVLKDKKVKDETIKTFLNEPFEFDFYTCSESEVPQTITVEQYNLIMEMVQH